ncbi:MAG: FAD-dependent oxidoreductase [Aggregatilineales bacterium]
MEIGIIGGGLMGTALAYYLAQGGHRVTLLEQASELGGLNGGLVLDDGSKVPRCPQPILPNDRQVRGLYAALELESDLVFAPVRTGFVHNGVLRGMSTLGSFLAFAPLPWMDRLRLGWTVAAALRAHDWAALEAVPARDWLVRLGGPQAFESIWAPLLEAKFDGACREIPATYVWSWLRRMAAARRLPWLQALAAVPRRGYGALIAALAAAVRGRGGQIMTDTRVREIEISQSALQQVRTHSAVFRFDAVIAAVPTPDFAWLIPGANEFYLAALARSRYLGLICPVLALDRPLSPYWTLNLTDPSSPFSSVVELPHPLDARGRVVYLPKFTAPDSDWMGVSDSDIRDAWLLRLRQIFTDLQPAHVRQFLVVRARYAEPVHFLNAADKLISVRTPYDGLYLANTSQVYPELPTSDAVIAHAQRVAQMVARQERPPLACTAAA